jgi:hypothetical protein
MAQLHCSRPPCFSRIVVAAHKRRMLQSPWNFVAPFYSCHCKTKSNPRVVDVMCIEENGNLS